MNAQDHDALDGAVWTDADFEQMGWHDATVHAIAFRESDDVGELLLDLDYIVRWIDPQPPSEYFRFLVAPATLVFENVWSLEGDLALYAKRTILEVDGIERHEPEDERQRAAHMTLWVIDGHEFGLRFLATGFRQHFRARPIEVESQRLSAEQRGGFSFEQPTAFPG